MHRWIGGNDTGNLHEIGQTKIRPTARAFSKLKLPIEYDLWDRKPKLVQNRCPMQFARTELSN